MIVGMDTNSFGFDWVSSAPLETMRDGTYEKRVFSYARAEGEASERRFWVYHHALSLFNELPKTGDESWVVIEEALILPKNIDTTRKLVMMTATIEAAFFAAAPNARIYWVDVSTWRREVLNPPKGQAPRNKDGWKALARQWVIDNTYYNSEQFDRHPDLYDAACIMCYGMRRIP